ncbi:YpbF family protein [Bacillus sp. 03113]|uniref:YpbF family protein n=1 Tax=Bacillus sp. 03113 TaxID=2578211 RepID=UPI0011450404|nr:YpbF family protein [Bacillus sp. 03113]
MENSIILLDERTDQATKQILQRVVEKKKKFDQYKFKHLLFLWLAVFIAFFYIYYLYRSIFLPYSYSFTTMFSIYVQTSLNVYLLILTVGLFGITNVLKKKVDKAEKEFHAIRCEIIDKSKDLWKKEEAWNNRHLVFEMMKKNYDINLYHENK